MTEKRRKNPILGALLMIPYSCVMGAALFLFIPSATVWAEKELQGTGPLVILVLIALGLIAVLVCWPLGFLSKSFLERANKPMAIVCGLIVGLPVTIGLIINAAQGLYSGGFTMGMFVLVGGVFPLLFAFWSVDDPKGTPGKTLGK